MKLLSRRYCSVKNRFCFYFSCKEKFSLGRSESKFFSPFDSAFVLLFFLFFQFCICNFIFSLWEMIHIRFLWSTAFLMTACKPKLSSQTGNGNRPPPLLSSFAWLVWAEKRSRRPTRGHEEVVLSIFSRPAARTAWPLSEREIIEKISVYSVLHNSAEQNQSPRS